jgi:uncharacterized protein YdhG (YjbR/CyaY superfamily)
MARTDFKCVDDYIAMQPEATQRVLARVRRIVRKAVPDAEEVISYQIPAYRLHGRMLLFFAGWKEHFSLYPLNPRIAKAFKKDLARYETSKGTIKIPLSEPVPVRLVEGFAKMRATEVTALNRVRARARRARDASRASQSAAKSAARPPFPRRSTRRRNATR